MLPPARATKVLATSRASTRPKGKGSTMEPTVVTAMAG